MVTIQDAGRYVRNAVTAAALIVPLAALSGCNETMEQKIQSLKGNMTKQFSQHNPDVARTSPEYNGITYTPPNDGSVVDSVGLIAAIRLDEVVENVNPTKIDMKRSAYNIPQELGRCVDTAYQYPAQGWGINNYLPTVFGKTSVRDGQTVFTPKFVTLDYQMNGSLGDIGDSVIYIAKDGDGRIVKVTNTYKAGAEWRHILPSFAKVIQETQEYQDGDFVARSVQNPEMQRIAQAVVRQAQIAYDLANAENARQLAPK